MLLISLLTHLGSINKVYVCMYVILLGAFNRKLLRNKLGLEFKYDFH